MYSPAFSFRSPPDGKPVNPLLSLAPDKYASLMMAVTRTGRTGEVMCDLMVGRIAPEFMSFFEDASPLPPVLDVETVVEEGPSVLVDLGVPPPQAEATAEDFVQAPGFSDGTVVSVLAAAETENPGHAHCGVVIAADATTQPDGPHRLFRETTLPEPGRAPPGYPLEPVGTDRFVPVSTTPGVLGQNCFAHAGRGCIIAGPTPSAVAKEVDKTWRTGLTSGGLDCVVGMVNWDTCSVSRLSRGWPPDIDLTHQARGRPPDHARFVFMTLAPGRFTHFDRGPGEPLTGNGDESDDRGGT